MRMVVERPADRHLDQRRRLPEAVGLAELGDVAAPCPVGQVVAAHQAAVVGEAVREQQIDGVRAQVPGRRAVAARLAAREAHDRLAGPQQVRLLLRAAHGGGGDVRPAVVGDLVPVRHHRRAFLGLALDGEARHEPGACGCRARPSNARMRPRGQRAELAARQRRRRGHAAGDEARLVSKSNVRQTMWRGMASLLRGAAGPADRAGRPAPHGQGVAVRQP